MFCSRIYKDVDRDELNNDLEKLSRKGIRFELLKSKKAHRIANHPQAFIATLTWIENV